MREYVLYPDFNHDDFYYLEGDSFRDAALQWAKSEDRDGNCIEGGGVILMVHSMDEPEDWVKFWVHGKIEEGRVYFAEEIFRNKVGER